MEDANFVFKELLERSGWNQAEAARNLDLQPPSVSRYLKGQDTPSRQTLRLFRMLLDSEAPSAREKPSAPPRETVAASTSTSAAEATELAVWKRRAIAAEKELEALKSSLRALLARPAPAVPAARPLSEAQQIARRAAEKYDAENREP